MPNTAVKAANAESTWGEAPWEDRKPLIKQKEVLANASASFFVGWGSLVADTLDEMSKTTGLPLLE